MMELRNKTITCLVSLPDSVVFAVDVDRNAEGRDVLMKVCHDLRILEVDYFGLTYHGLKGEELWLNLRNPISAELSASPPFRLQLCFKFFVETHFIQQKTTRDQFFLNVKQQFLSGKLRFASEDEIIALSALLFVIHNREAVKSFTSSSGSDYEQFLPVGYRSMRSRNLIVNQMTKFEALSEESAKSQFLEAASRSPLFGVHLHEAKDETGKVHRIGVGRDGLTEYGEDWQLVSSYGWSAIQSATHNALSVIITTVRDDGVTATHSVKLASKMSAAALYRDMTEVHSFFHCDTIGSLVTEQFCRDLKGTIISFFDETTCLGKRYVFDIEHTLREAYDYVRRILYATERRNVPTSPSGENSGKSGFVIPDLHQSCSSNCQALQQLHSIRDSLTCHICVDADIDTAFVPCGHTVCCSRCAQRLDCCPVCKHPIDLVQPVFLPYVRSMFSTIEEGRVVACT